MNSYISIIGGRSCSYKALNVAVYPELSPLSPAFSTEEPYAFTKILHST